VTGINRLALDVLVEVGTVQHAPKEFWRQLHETAKGMNLSSEHVVHGGSVRTIDEWMVKDDLYPCPCCGWMTLDGQPGTDEFCAVCGWQDDVAQLRFPTMGGGANRLSLVEAQFAYAQSSSSDSVTAGRLRDSEWRLVNPEIDAIEVPEPGKEYGMTYASDPRTYYYWRRSTR
jgi:hypothetical protein